MPQSFPKTPRRSVHVHLLPDLVDRDRMQGHAATVIDVLRATTTMATALAAGAVRIRPCLHVQEARDQAASMPGSLLGGERGGLRVDGFDLGNSPAEYTPERVAGKTIVMTTTNGTRAIEHCGKAARVWTSAFVNLTASVNAWIACDFVELHIVCAGTDGVVTREDTLLAGALTAKIVELERETSLNDEAQIALATWRSPVESGEDLGELLSQSLGGRNLARIGQASDIARAAQIDLQPVLPEYCTDRGEVRLM